MYVLYYFETINYSKIGYLWGTVWIYAYKDRCVYLCNIRSLHGQ
jgi:hypothetical protein